MIIRLCVCIPVLILILSGTLFAEIRLPKLIADGMVLQRGADTSIWGWADPGEQIAVHFLDTIYTTGANQRGEWQISMTGLTAGGPYQMQLVADNAITIRDILIGDVWICSGQSNMELNMQRVSPLYKDEIAVADYPFIRYFEVPDRYNFNREQKDLPKGQWRRTTPESLPEFSAVSYFFGKALYEQYQIPIGLINAALGGSPAEAWISEKGLKSFPTHYEEALRFKDSTLIEKIQREDKHRINGWYSELRRRDKGYADRDKPWYGLEFEPEDWQKMDIPGYWSDADPAIKNGVVWFRKEIEIPPDMAGKPAKLNLGRIIDADSTYVNGIFIGTTSYQYPPRRYSVPAGILKEGKNILVVRVISNSGKGGFLLDKPYELVAGEDTIDLKGTWKYRAGAAMQPLKGETFIRWKPLGLYNAMIAPLTHTAIKGVIWYQGESNADRPEEYPTLFPALINDWRRNWGQGDFPFLFVQLPNFMEAKQQPSESNWALLREAQLKTLALPNTGMAVTIDIGEWNDIHPLNKKDVGERLALVARKVAYGEDIVASGPVYKSMRIDGNKVELSFANMGSGLTTKGNGELKGFAIAGANGKFVWANAKIAGEKVIVWSDNVVHPAAVRYAWADNPVNANLYNKEGLPAAPFRTDTFKSRGNELQ